MTLRQKIAAAVRAADGDADKAAILICQLLENEIGLSGNGWFDDDRELLEKLS